MSSSAPGHLLTYFLPPPIYDPTLGSLSVLVYAAPVISRAICACAILSVLLVGVVFASPAGAWRRPTASEKRAITRQAKHTPHHGSPKKKIHVSDIRVSTVGPWAIATIALYFNHRPLTAYAFLHKIGHRWHLSRGSGTGVSCNTGMPERVQEDLEVPC